MSNPVLLDHPHQGVARITLNRPERLNAIDNDLLSAFYEVLDIVDGDQAVRCIVLTGAGRGFCSGIDLLEIGTTPGTENLGLVPAGFTLQQRLAGIVTRMRRVRQPIIAAVNGAAAGGGFAFALGSDVRIAADSARFSAAFIKVGLSACEVSVSWSLPRLIGASNAHLLMLTGRLISAAEAHRMGMLAAVVPEGQLLDEAYQLADEMAANSPLGLWMTKEVMWSALEIPSQHAAIDLENRTSILCSMTDDSAEQRAAYLEKRAAVYHWR